MNEQDKQYFHDFIAALIIFAAMTIYYFFLA